MQRNAAIFSIAVALLTACCPVGDNQPPPSKPALRDYTVDQQIEIAKARAGLPPNSILREVLDDWERTRQELK